MTDEQGLYRIIDLRPGTYTLTFSLTGFSTVKRDGALWEMRFKQGKPQGALDGVPITIKENIYTRGDPAPIGTAANPDVLAVGRFDRRQAAGGGN